MRLAIASLRRSSAASGIGSCPPDARGRALSGPDLMTAGGTIAACCGSLARARRAVKEARSGRQVRAKSGQYIAAGKGEAAAHKVYASRSKPQITNRYRFRLEGWAVAVTGKTACG